MNDETFTPEEAALIERLRQAPQHRLSPRTVEAIRQRMLDEMVLPAPDRSRAPLRLPVSTRLLASAAAVLLVVLLGGLLVIRQAQTPPLPSPTPAAQVAVEVSATPSPTITPVFVPTQTAVPSFTPTLSVSATFSVPTSTQTVTSTPTTLPPIPSPDATITPDFSAAPIIIVEGQIEDLEANLIRMYGLAIEVAPEHPILNLLAVGDILRIEGSIGENGRLVAAVIDTLTPAEVTTADATVGLDGPVEDITANLVTINGIEVAFAPGSSLLRTLRVGDFVSIEGNFEQRDGRFVLAVVTAEVLDAPADGLSSVPDTCVYEDTGMGMGRWRCRGRGMAAMGMSGMSGMGDGMSGMGMGN